MVNRESIADKDPGSSAKPILRLGCLHSPTEQPRLDGFLSNLKDFFGKGFVQTLEREPAIFSIPQFGAKLGENMKEFLRLGPRCTGKSTLLVNWRIAFGSFLENLHAAICIWRLRPMGPSGRTFPGEEIWSRNTQFKRVQALSVAYHIVVLVLIIAPAFPRLNSPGTTHAKTRVTYVEDISLLVSGLPPGDNQTHGGGAGGAHDPRSESKGALAMFSMIQLTPPFVRPPENPRFPAPPSILGNPANNLLSPNINNWGNPLSNVINDSSGPGGGGGIGNGCCGGVGNGDGRGFGPGKKSNVGDGYPTGGSNAYSIPVCLYCPNPQFSEEAVKTKLQGRVMLTAIITPDGRATDMRVVQGLGLDLDEKAVEAVRTWRFKPAIGPDKKPVAVRQIIECEFHLY